MIEIKRMIKDPYMWFLYFILLFSGGFYFFEFQTIIGIVILSVFIFCLRSKPDSNLRSVQSSLIPIIVVSEACALIFYGIDLKLFVAHILMLFVAIQIVFVTPKDVFFKYFIFWIIVISVASDIAYLLGLHDFSLFSKFPSFYNSNGRVGYFGFIFCASDFTLAGVQRNQGIFWEPGAFQCYIIMAYVSEIIYNSKPRTWVLILFLITLFTTMSTTGILAGVVLFFYSLYNGFIGYSKRLAVPLFFILLYFMYKTYTLLESTDLYYTLFVKTSQVADYRMGDDNESSSRVESVIYPFLEGLKSPLWGIGSAGIATFKYKTCTPVTMFAVYGFFYLYIMLRGIYLLIKNNFNRLSHISIFVLFCVIWFSVSTEAFEFNYVFFALCLYGYKHFDNFRLNENNSY